MYSNYSGLSGLDKNNFKTGQESFIPYKKIFEKNYIFYSDCENFNLKNKIQNPVEKWDILITATSETVNEVGISAVYVDNKRIYLNSFCFGLKKINNLINSIYFNFLLGIYKYY